MNIQLGARKKPIPKPPERIKRPVGRPRVAPEERANKKVFTEFTLTEASKAVHALPPHLRAIMNKPDPKAPASNYERGMSESRPSISKRILTNRDTVEAFDRFDISDPEIYREQLIVAIQLLMSQGVYSKAEYEHLYGASMMQINTAIHEIAVRHKVSGQLMDVKGMRAEMLDKYAFLEAKLWSDYHNSHDPKLKSMIVGNLIKVLDQRANISGLSKEQIAMVLEIKGDSEIMGRVRRQEGVLTIFEKICDKLDEVQTRDVRGAVIEMREEEHTGEHEPGWEETPVE